MFECIIANFCDCWCDQISCTFQQVCCVVDRHDHRLCRCSVWRSPAGPHRGALMRIVSGDGTPVKAGSSITLGSLNCWPKWWVTRSFSSAALQITRPESSWIISLLAGFLVISWTARNIFAPSWRRSTSEARWSSLTDALSRALRRCACRILLRCCLSSCLRAGFLVLFICSRSLRCVSDRASNAWWLFPNPRHS